MKLSSILLSLVAIHLGSSFISRVSADELRLPRSELVSLGMKPVKFSPHFSLSPSTSPRTEPESGRPWPVTFKSQEHSIAQNYVQHQDYGSGQYYHGGCDLRAEPRSWATAPVDGILEGGYYGYDTEADGQDVKWWKAWDGHPTASLYFELAIITPDGYRYELHHVDPMTLPTDTVRALNTGGVRVTSGTKLALVAKWPTSYDHVHYNIVRPDGVHMNPEAYSVEVPDHEAPKILGVYAIQNAGVVLEVSENTTLPKATKEFAVVTTESRDGNGYVQTPPWFDLTFTTGKKSGWDFRKTLSDAAGKWIDIRNVFLEEIRPPHGRRIKNSGNYGKGQFIVRVPMPTDARGDFILSVGDTAGNVSTLHGRVE